jgi:hypothetical protein
MGKKNIFTRILAIIGSILVWLPILAPILFGVVSWIVDRRFRFDYLLPAELFWVVLVGGGLLLWAALRARSRRGIIGGGLGAAVVLLVASMLLAELTGLASGGTEPVGWQWAVVVASLAGYLLAILVVGIGGALLVRDLFNRLPTPVSNP